MRKQQTFCGENERRLYLPDLHTLSGSQTANDKSPHCKSKQRKWKEWEGRMKRAHSGKSDVDRGYERC